MPPPGYAYAGRSTSCVAFSISADGGNLFFWPSQPVPRLVIPSAQRTLRLFEMKYAIGDTKQNQVYAFKPVVPTVGVATQTRVAIS